MPNHVTNNLTFRGDPEAIQRMLEAVKNDEEGLGSIDFNKLIPMPPELDMESGTRTMDGRKLYSDFVEIYKLGKGPDADLLNIPKASEEAFLRQRKDIDRKTWKLGRSAFQNALRFGHSTWYSWRTANWGTKWNAYGFTSDGDNLAFHTAWSAPHPVIRELSKRYPEIEITHAWADEDIGQNCGRFEYLGGELTEQFLPAFGRESYEFAASVWDTDLSDYGLVLNADETDYIWAGSQRYDVMELLGQRVLHTNFDLGLSDIPLGMQLYFLGTTDDRGRFDSIESVRPKNFGGSIVTLEPITLNEEGIRALTEDEAPRVTGEKLTFEELLQETITEDEALGGMQL